MPAKTQSRTQINEAARLRRENEKLKKELEKLQVSTSTSHHSFSWKAFFKWLSISMAGAIFIVASVVFYVGMTLTNTDRFMKVAEPLAKQPAVQSAVVTKTTDALFNQVDVDSLALSVLPDKVDFLAPTVSNQIKEYTKKQAQTIVASDQFQQTWNSTVRTAHERLITQLKNYEGDGTINLNDAFTALTQRLEGGKLAFLSGKKLPPKVGNIVIIQSDWLPAAHTFVSNFAAVRAFTIFLFFALIALALWLSENRRKTLIQLSAIIAIASLLLLVALRILRRITLDNADPTYSQAANEIWSVLSRPFAIQLITTLLIGMAIVVVAWLGSRSKSAVAMRARIESLFAGHLHQTVFPHENAFTLWVGRYEKLLLTVIGVLFVASLLFIELSLGSLVSSIILAIIAALAIVALSGQKEQLR